MLRYKFNIHYVVTILVWTLIFEWHMVNYYLGYSSIFPPTLLLCIICDFLWFISNIYDHTIVC